MAYLPDLNVWLALVLEGHAQHAAARRWYAEAPLGPGELGLCRTTEMGFVRLLTQERILRACGRTPLSNDEAVAWLGRLRADPAVDWIDEDRSTRALWLQLARDARPAPHRWADAWLAALAIGHDLELVTFDRGFVPWADVGLRVVLLPGSS